MRFKTLLAGAAALAWMLLAQPALGARVWTSDFGLTRYEAGPGEINTVKILHTLDAVFITDLTATITVQTSSCTSVSPNEVRCDSLGKVLAGDRADSVDVERASDLPAGHSHFRSVYGGPGPDTLIGGDYPILLNGGPGDDRLVGRSGFQDLRGSEGEDSLEGGPGDDHLRGGPGNDSLAGGPGFDLVDYSDHTTPVNISLDGRANDGATGAGELDWIHADVEDAYGSRGRTIFIGNAGRNFFGGRSDGGDVVRTGAGDDFVLAGPGPDVVYGQGGNDGLFGGRGRDVLSGGPGGDFLEGNRGADLILGGRGNDLLLGLRGADDLRGGSGDDRLWGGYENDTIRGGPGRDRLRGERGSDVFYARDRSRDQVDGGRGTDRAHVDSIDVLLRIEVRF